MYRVIPLLLCVLLAALPGCKIVYDSELADEVPEGPDGDAARNTARLEATFDTQLMPLITDDALEISELRSAIAAGLDEAGAAHGNRGSGRGAAWNFPVRAEGKIVAAKLDTSARTILVDTDDDGAGDITVQLGPVIKGTALRDAAPFFNFDDFRDQIEFAKLSRAINDRIKPTLIVPDGALVGQTARFTGVVPLKKATDKMVLTPVMLAFAP